MASKYPAYKTFGGVRYKFTTAPGLKSTAQKQAKWQRDHGKLARVVQHPNKKWSVYTRSKKNTRVQTSDGLEFEVAHDLVSRGRASAKKNANGTPEIFHVDGIKYRINGWSGKKGVSLPNAQMWDYGTKKWSSAKGPITVTLRGKWRQRHNFKVAGSTTVTEFGKKLTGFFGVVSTETGNFTKAQIDTMKKSAERRGGFIQVEKNAKKGAKKNARTITVKSVKYNIIGTLPATKAVKSIGVKKQYKAMRPNGKAKYLIQEFSPHNRRVISLGGK